MSAERRSLGDLLRRHRLAAGLSQAELADRAGLSRRGVSDIERGAIQAPHHDTLARLADALELAAADRTTLHAAARGRFIQELAEPRSASATQPTLVGRQQELALIERHLAGETAPLLMFAGEPGIGKSRLLAEAATQASARGWRVIAGGCTRRSGQAPYEPILSALAQELRSIPPARQRLDLQGCGWLVRLLPELLEAHLVPAPTWTLPPDQERRLIFDAVARYLANMSGPKGTLLLLDDLQWAEGDALALLEALVGKATQSHSGTVRLLGAYRLTEVHLEDPLGLLLADLAREGAVERYQLPLLTHEEASALLAQLWPQGEETDIELAARAEALHRADGLPFYLVCGVRAFADKGGPLNTAAGSRQIPASVAESVQARVAALPVAARSLIGAAAVAGRVVPGALLLATTSLTEDETLEALKALSRAGLLVEGAEESYRFSHDLIREVIEEELGSQQRRTLHRRLAEALERDSGLERKRLVAEIASHYLAAGEHRRALPYVLLAGDQAEAVYAHVEAKDHYQTALDLAQRLGDTPHEALALEKLGGALWEGEVYLNEAREMSDRAAQLFQSLGDREGELRALAAIALRHGGIGQVEACEARLLPRLAALEADATAQDGPGLARVYANLATVYSKGFRRRETLDALERGEHFARTVQDDALRLHMLHRRVAETALLGIDYPNDEALEIIALAERLGDMRRSWTGLLLAFYDYTVRGDFACARDYLERLTRQDRLLQARGSSSDNIGEFVLANISEFAFYIGDWRGAREASRQSIAIEERNEPFGARFSSGYGSLNLGVLELAEGHEEAAISRLEPALTRALAKGDLQALVFITRSLVEADLLAGRTETARSRLALAYAHPGLQYPSFLSALLAPVLAWADLDLRRGDEARDEIEACEAYARAHELRLFLPDILRVRALIALADSHWQEAEEALNGARSLARDIPLPWAELKALWVFGQLEAAHGDSVEARERFKEALAICDHLGEGLYRPHIERALIALGA
jgi:transcriptional regulator with XRE-family HTH domain